MSYLNDILVENDSILFDRKDEIFISVFYQIGPL